MENTAHFTVGQHIDPRDYPGASPGSDLKTAGPSTSLPVRQMERVDPITVKIEQAHRGVIETIEHRSISGNADWIKIGHTDDHSQADYDFVTYLFGTGVAWLPGDVGRPAPGGGLEITANTLESIQGMPSIWLRCPGSVTVVITRRRYALPRA